jgi:hypothetical protein
MKNIFWKIVLVFFAVIVYYEIKILVSESPDVTKQKARDEIRERVRTERLNETEEEKQIRLAKEDEKEKQRNSIYQNNRTNSRNWYEGGKLHKSSINEWRNSSYSNKLATCGDWMAVVNNKITMDELKDRSESLLICIDEAVAMDENGQEISGNLKVVDIASGCITLLRY